MAEMCPHHASVVLDLPRQHLVLRHQGAVQVEVRPRRQRHQQQEEHHDRGDLCQRRVDALRAGGDFCIAQAGLSETMLSASCPLNSPTRP